MSHVPPFETGATHTPGPWKVGSVGSVFSIQSDTHCVAFTNSGSKSPEAVKAKIHQDAEQAANARLIAASPELLKALEEAINWNSHDDEGFPAVWLDQARAALAKAKGVSGD